MLKVLLALFFVVILIAPGLTWWVAQRPVPVLDGVGEINGMSKSALVRYDSRAIPYIKADSDEDVYASQGYVVARERMFQMDMLRRAAEGRIAQVFGLNALPTDRLVRTIGFERLAEDELKNLTPQAKVAVEAYSRGVNAYLEQNSDKLPAEFTLLSYKPEPWRDVDSLAVMKYLAYELDESWKLDNLRWRVTNRVGDNMAGRLFNDNLAVSSWSPDAKSKNMPAVLPGSSVSNSSSNTNSAVKGAQGKSQGGKVLGPKSLHGATGVAAPRQTLRRSIPSTSSTDSTGSTGSSSTSTIPSRSPSTAPSSGAPSATPTGGTLQPGAFINSPQTQLLATRPIQTLNAQTLPARKRSSSTGEKSQKAGRGTPCVPFNASNSLDYIPDDNRNPEKGHAWRAPTLCRTNTLNPAFVEKFTAMSKSAEFFRKPERTWGSTSWVLSPTFSKSGGAMMAADKHSALTTPCEFFLCALQSNNMHVAGAALPGVPGIMFGRNQDACWSGSSMHADVQDLFVEHFASEQDNKYKTPGKVEVAKEFHEAIPVRFGKDVDHKITITKHGPVLFRDKDSAIALSWTGFETKKPWINTITALNRARDWDSFVQSLSTYGGPPQLFVFADKRGNVGCHAAGLLPVRAGGAQGTTMSEGWLANGEWVSTVEFDDLPQSFVPAASAGKPGGDFCVAAGQRLYAPAGGSAGFPAVWGHQWDAPYRANRLALSLPRQKNAGKLDLLDFNAYQGDELNMMANLVVTELRKSIDANKSIDASQAKAMDLMQHWDFCIKHDSAAATCYESFIGTLARRLIEPQLNGKTGHDGHDLANEYFQNWPLWTTFVEDYLRHKQKDLLPPEERTHDTFMVTTFDKSNTRLKTLFKADKVEDWVWDKAHIINFHSVGVQGVSWMRKVLDITGIGAGGDSNCLNACDVDRLSMGGPFNCNNGPSVRLLIDMSEDDMFYGNLALGQSGHYFSPYRQDQLKSWLRADPLPIAFSEAQVEKQSKQKFYLSAPGYR